MVTEQFSLDPVAAQLVKDGVITVTVVFTRDGLDTWARACQRHPGLGLSPQQSLPLEDLLEVFQKHHSLKGLVDASTSPGRQGLVSPTPPRAAPKEEKYSHKVNRTVQFANNSTVEGKSNLLLDGLSVFPTSSEGLRRMTEVLSAQSVESCQSIVRIEGLDHTRINGVDNILPKDSLTKVDLQHGPLKVYSRMVAVANHLGNAKLVSRIRSSQKFNISVVPNLESWWNAATLNDKLSLLSSNSKLSVTKALGSLDDRSKRGLSSLPHPFRGGAEEMVVFDEPREYDSSGSEDDN